MIPGVTRSYALQVAARVLAAVPFGYALTHLFAGAVPLWLPIARTEAVLWTSIASFTFYTAVILYAFAVSSVWRLWRDLALLALLLLLAIGWRT